MHLATPRQETAVFKESWQVVVAFCLVLASIALANPQSQNNTVAIGNAGDNAATLWQDIFPHLQYKNESGLTQEDWDSITRIASGSPPPTQKQLEIGRLAMTKLGPVLDKVVSTSKLRKCDFKHDYSQGFEMEMPELGSMQLASRILGARANLALAEGDWDIYLESVGASSNLSRQVAQLPVMISSLISSSIGLLSMDNAQYLVDEGSLTPEKAAKLLEAMDPLRGADPHGYADAMNEEYTVLISSTLDGKALAQMGGDTQVNEPYQKLNAEEIHEAMVPLEGVYKEMAACFREPNIEAALKKHDAAIATMELSSVNPQALPHSFFPAINKCLNRFFAQQAKRNALMETLQGIASGKLNAGALGVPAIWWSRAAAAARALNDEQQATVELLRLSSVTDDSPLLSTAITTLDACDTTVFEYIRRAMACESKVVSFAKLSSDDTPLDLALVGGLRGAARIALAKSMLPKHNAEQSLGLICMAIAASNALTSDPTFTHALTSQSIAEEIAVAVGHFAIRRGVTDELRGKLDLAIATIPRSDAFGFRSAQNKLRGVLANDLAWNFERTHDMTEELNKALAQKSTPWLFAVDIVYRSSEKPAASPDGTLVSMDDVFTPDSVKEIAAAWEARQIQIAKDREKENAQVEPEPLSKIPKHQRVQKFLNKINPPTMRDIALDMNRVADALSSIDKAAAKRRADKK